MQVKCSCGLNWLRTTIFTLYRISLMLRGPVNMP